MELHPGETIIYEGHPSWRSILDFYLKGLVVAVVLGGIALAVVDTLTGVLVFLVIESLAVAIGLLKRIGTEFIITSERLHIRRGLLAKRVQQTQLQRVQNVNTNQSFLERVLRVGTVDFDTAGTDDSDFVFDGVASPEEVVAAVDRAQRASTATDGSV